MLLTRGMILLTAAVLPALCQQPDQAWFGMWKMKGAPKITGTGAPPPPKMATVSISQSGWVYAEVDARGSLMSNAATSGSTCTLIGMPSSFTCEQSWPDGRHYNFTLKNNGQTMEDLKVELVDDNTFKSTSQMSMPSGMFTSEATFVKAPPPSPPKPAPKSKKK